VTKEKVLNAPLIEDGTLLLYATKVRTIIIIRNTQRQPIKFIKLQLDQGDVVRTLLSAGADPGIQNASGENSLDTASTSHMKQIYVDELLRATGNSEYALAHHFYITVF
jgi:hypothetical protein